MKNITYKNTYFDKNDIIERFIHSSGNGGQNVNKVATCVYLKHIPTGIEIKCQKYRTQAENRIEARRMLSERIEEARRKKRIEEISQFEKFKRQTRLKPQSLKNRILEEKKRNSLKKYFRGNRGKMDI